MSVTVSRMCATEFAVMAMPIMLPRATMGPADESRVRRRRGGAGMGLARKICAIATPMWLTLALSAPPASADPDVTLAERLDAAIAAKIAEMGVPGAIVGISVP